MPMEALINAIADFGNQGRAGIAAFERKYIELVHNTDDTELDTNLREGLDSLCSINSFLADDSFNTLEDGPEEDGSYG